MSRCVVTLTGPSAAGKSHLERALQAAGFGRVISTTTRAARQGEVDGVDYHFVTREGFDQLEENVGMVESTEFGGNRYGMTVPAMNAAMAGTGRMVVVLEPNGARQMREHCDDQGIAIVSVWVDCPVLWQAQRFLARGLPPEVAAKRLATMLSDEVQWRRSASCGIIFGSPYRYALELWQAGPDMQDVYVEGITARVEQELLRAL